DRRFQHAADLKVTLEELKEESDSGRLTLAPARSPVETRNLSRLVLPAALLLLTAASVWLWWTPRPNTTVVRPLTRLTSNGISFSPAISADGKLLAFLSSVSGSNPDIWVQQIGGGKAIQVTRGVEGASSPVFSPDGTQIAYAANGSIYEVPALGGESRLITSDGFGPIYTIDSSTIIFVRAVQGWFHLFKVPRIGGTPVSIQTEAGLLSVPVLSPDGTELLALASRPGQQEQDFKRWWTIPIAGGKLAEITPPLPLLPIESQAPEPLVWTMPDKGSRQQWIIFRRSSGDTDNLFRVGIRSDGKLTSDPEQLTHTTGFSNYA